MLISTKENWKLYLDWANLYLMQLRVPQMQDQANQIFESALQIIERVDSANLKKDRYADWAITSFKAFCELALMSNKTKPIIYSEMDFSEIPLGVVNDAQKGKEFYAHFFKSIVLAVELRDSNLLMKLLKMISVDDATLMGDGTLLAKFQQTLNDTMDLRPEFAAEFNLLYALAPVLKIQFPNWNLFVSYLESQNHGGLHYFFKAIK